MPLLKKGVPIPVKGIDFSKPYTFLDSRNSFPINMQYVRAEMIKRYGKTSYYNAMNSGIVGLGVLDLDTVKYLLRASITGLERLDTSLGSWVSVVSTPFSGTVDNLFMFATVAENGLVIITNGFDKPRKYTGSGNASALGGGAPLAKYVTYLTPYVIFAYTDSGSGFSPWNVWWSDTGNPEQYLTGNSGQQLLSSEPSVIQNIINLETYAIVYKEKSIWLGQDVGSPNFFQFYCVATGIGLGSPRAIVEAESIHYFMGQNDFFSYNLSQPQSIGDAVREYVFPRLERSSMNRNFAIHIQNLNEVWFFVTISGNSFPTEVWKFNYRKNFWYYDTCSNLTSAAIWARINTISWDESIGTWDQQRLIWDATSQTISWDDIIFGDTYGNTSILDYNVSDDLGVAVTSSFSTKSFIGDDDEDVALLGNMKRWLMLDVWATGPGNLYVDYSLDEGTSWINAPATRTDAAIVLTSINSIYRIFFDVVSDKISFRFRNADLGGYFLVRNFQPYYLPREEARR